MGRSLYCSVTSDALILGGEAVLPVPILPSACLTRQVGTLFLKKTLQRKTEATATLERWSNDRAS